jgi:hypothetical protein
MQAIPRARTLAGTARVWLSAVRGPKLRQGQLKLRLIRQQETHPVPLFPFKTLARPFPVALLSIKHTPSGRACSSHSFQTRSLGTFPLSSSRINSRARAYYCHSHETRRPSQTLLSLFSQSHHLTTTLRASAPLARAQTPSQTPQQHQTPPSTCAPSSKSSSSCSRSSSPSWPRTPSRTTPLSTSPRPSTASTPSPCPASTPAALPT